MPRRNNNRPHVSRQTPLSVDQRVCDTKNRYATENDARRAAEHQEVVNSLQGIELSVYACPLCRGWHLTRRRD